MTTSPLLNSPRVAGPRATLRERPASHLAQLIEWTPAIRPTPQGVAPTKERRDYALYCGAMKGSEVSQANRKPVGDVATEENYCHHWRSFFFWFSNKQHYLSIATRLLRCVAVLREWIRVTAPGNSLTGISSC